MSAKNILERALFFNIHRVKSDFYNRGFLFIRGLFCPICIQNSLSLNCFKRTIPGFSHNCLPVSCGAIGYFKKIPRSSIGLEVKPQSAFSVQRALLPSANCSAEWSGFVWQSSADINGLLGHHYCQQRAVTPDPESFNSNIKGARLPLLFAEGCPILLDGQHCPLITYQGVFFYREEKPSDALNSRYFWWIRKG